jgi:hypothetical protein
MIQAGKTNTPIPTRRALLARAPAAAALALAVPVSALGGAVIGNDAELLALGARLDWLIAEEERVYELEAPCRAAFNRVRAEMQAEDRPHTNEEWNARLQHIDKLQPPGPSSEDLLDQMDAPMRRIAALPAHTVAGLAVKARATAVACRYMYSTHFFEDAEWDHMHVRMLVAAVLTMAGQPLIDGEV